MSFNRVRIKSIIDLSDITIDDDTKRTFKFIYKNYKNHMFDLLGSGTTDLSYKSEQNKFKFCKHSNETINTNYFNFKWIFKNFTLLYYINIFYNRNLLSKDYSPIDWHMDFKSKFRFSSKKFKNTESCNYIIEKIKGVDTKLPWELGRMYHLLQIALIAIYNNKVRIKCIIEFKNEVLDFIFANPVGKTVQWSSIMDVSIRAVNLLISYDILSQLDDYNILNDRFNKIFYKCMKKHGQYILKNLDGEANNHYLSDVIGLIFISAYLKSNIITDSWLVFGTQELIKEVKRQFHSDGGHFEGSTSYHRFSLELVLYATALILGITKTSRKKAYTHYNHMLIEKLEPLNYQKYNLKSYDFFPKWYFNRIILASMFTKTIMNNQNEIVQVGDNDSGRLLKLSPIGNIISYDIALKKYSNLKCKNSKYYFDENILDHSSLLSASFGLFNKEFKNYAQKYPLECSFIRALSKNKIVKSDFNFQNKVNLYSFDTKYLNIKKTTRFIFKSLDRKLTDNIRFINYNMFGLCLFKSDLLYLSIVVDTTKHIQSYGHCHNDKLSFELIVDNIPIVRDAGTYVYTPFLEKRNEFRSIKSHNTICVNGKEQNSFRGTFDMFITSKGYIIEQTNCYIKLLSKYRDIIHCRKFTILDNSIVIDDYCNNEFYVNFNYMKYSNGYGKLINKNWILNNFNFNFEDQLDGSRNIIIDW